MNEKLAVCTACGSTDIVRKLVSRAYGKDESDLILIDDVPIDVCRACGESYVSAQTLKQIEDLRGRREMLSRVSIPVGHISLA